ncbi:MAG: protein kinase domain-containing protein [Pirellulaceae bacterium]
MKSPDAKLSESPLTDPYQTVSPAPGPVASVHPGPVDNVQPMPIGRYRVERILGKGGFGCVYLAYDEQLSRHVAVKVPHPHLVSRPEDAQLYLAEARTVARLDHPHIVPVYDVGSTPDCPFFVVSKYVEGANLAGRLAQSRLSSLQAAELVATVAAALHYAHKQGLVHRDVKPGNILVATDGQPFVVDFGLALREEDSGKGQRYAGTPAYFSPEQARGEGHRVDGRSDIFSLGIVLYELLVGHRPFRSETQQELLEQISSQEPRPPRQHDESIPKELERICFKALAKRASERYSSAHDLAEDLRHFLATFPQQASDRFSLPVPQTSGEAGVSTPYSGSTHAATPTFESHTLRIIPKGLRSFDAHDADFFLELLPGPRDREGLPDSIRFWKTKIEDTDPDSTFSVGLIYGPSGCGKSSLVKAGLLPRLSPDIIPIYVEATANESEARLLSGLRKRCATVSADAGLKETLVSLRRGQGIPPGRKVLIVLDQFEQWLHAKKEETSTELAQALRQCDGGRVQAIVMVRDDFWMAATRFMRELEIRLLEGQNSAAVDLFDQDHAKRVLAAFGRAFGRLPEKPGDISKEQKEFLNQAVQGLLQDGKVICVRLAVFAEMMKGKPWTPATLKEVGGTAGIGVTFLEETFSAATAPPEHRYHQKAARAVLKALLPDSGADIKGHMRSFADLLEASGYANRPQDFQDLVRILNSELRLITPTDPGGQEHVDESATPAQPGEKYYQLTHDYLVHSLRDWVTRKQKETRRGRAELLLADRAAVWNARPENRQLPSLRQYFSIQRLTSKKNWTLPQQRMMRQASRYHALRGLMAALILALLGWGSYEGYGTVMGRALRDRLLDANTNEVPAIVQEMAPYRRWIDPLLRKAYQQAETQQEPRKQLHASLALLPVDARQKDYLYVRLCHSTIDEFAVVRKELTPHCTDFTSRLWQDLRTSPLPADRFRAGLALAGYSPDSLQWSKEDSDFIARQLIEAPPNDQPQLRNLLQSIHGKLLGPLGEMSQNPTLDPTLRQVATGALIEYAPDDAATLAKLATEALPGQYRLLFNRLTELSKSDEVRAAILKTLLEQVKQGPAEEVSEKESVALGRRRARAAITLLRFGERRDALSALQAGTNPESLSQFVTQARSFGLSPEDLLGCLELTVDEAPRYGLLLALGDFSPADLPASAREKLTEHLQAWRRDDRSAAVHAACDWLLHKWEIAPSSPGAPETKPPSYDPENQRQWFVLQVGSDRLGFVAFPPGGFVRGSPAAENLRVEDESRHPVRFTRPLAVLDREITIAQWLQFLDERKLDRQIWEERDKRPVMYRQPAHPAYHVNWYEAVEYCRWLTDKAGMDETKQCYVEDRSELATEAAAGKKPDAIEKKLLLPVKRWTFHPDRPGFRLPTEAEWERACRAGTTTTFSFGCDPTLLKYSSAHLSEEAERRPYPGGTKMPNLRGLFDMHGNVWEWCQDTQVNYQAMQLETDPIGLVPTNNRAYRGGSFDNYTKHHRAACRIFELPTLSFPYLGFRVVCTLPTKEQ